MADETVALSDPQRAVWLAEMSVGVRAAMKAPASVATLGTKLVSLSVFEQFEQLPYHQYKHLSRVGNDIR